MRFDILTLFPGLFHAYLQEGVIGRAIREGIIQANVSDIREYATDKHKTTDDYPYGGGPGLVMKIEPLARAVESLPKMKKSRTIFLSPQGARFDATHAERLSKMRRLVLICGRYEGVDQRFRDAYVDEEFSIGDYVLSGGELPALVMLDAIARFIPNVLGNKESAPKDSFSDGLLEHPQYTKPADFQGLKVPEVLLSGNHKAIAAWRLSQSEERTKTVRPDLWEKYRKK